MTPDHLVPLFAPLTTLRGMGPPMGSTVVGLLKRAIGGERLIDVLFHLPEGYLDRRTRPTLQEALRSVKAGQVVTLSIEVVRHEPPGSPRQPWRVVVTDGTGFAELVFFHFTRAELMAPGAKLLVSGKLERYGSQLTMPHPDYVVPATQPERIPDIDPAWRLTAGLWPRQVGWAMTQALERLPALPEWHDPALLRRERWPGFADALRLVHAPTSLPTGELT